MIVFLIFTVLYQIALNSALDPLLNYLPKSMDAEERHLLAQERAELDREHGANGNGPDAEKGEGYISGHKDMGPPPHAKPNFITKFLRPDIYTDYATMRRLVPKDVEIHYGEEAENDAYFHPSITNTTPLLWVPRDPIGVSRTECAQTSEIIPITDEGAYLDEKNKIVWDADDGRPPIYQEKVYY
jgi:calcium permeable stress-gated cation channel